MIFPWYCGHWLRSTSSGATSRLVESCSYRNLRTNSGRRGRLRRCAKKMMLRGALDARTGKKIRWVFIFTRISTNLVFEPVLPQQECLVILQARHRRSHRCYLMLIYLHATRQIVNHPTSLVLGNSPEQLLVYQAAR